MQINGMNNVLASDKNVLEQSENISENNVESDVAVRKNKTSARQDSTAFSAEASSLIEQFQNAQKNADKESEAYEDMIKCLTIASRIIAGDKVPYKDQKFLQEKEPDIYFKANLLKTPKLKPKEHKSVLGDDEEDEDTENGNPSVNELDISIEGSGSSESSSSEDLDMSESDISD